ncbi:MAG: hypothetical protein ACLUNQ_08800 [Oscillospiraceae bacterium]
MGTEFRPIIDLVRRHEATADHWVTVAVARPGGCEHLSLGLHRDGAMAAADEEYALLLVKTALWLRGAAPFLRRMRRFTDGCKGVRPGGGAGL